MPSNVRDYKIRFTESGARRVRQETDNLDNRMTALTTSLKSLGAAAVAAAASFAAFRSIELAGQFETLKVRLDNMFGSVEAGTRAFDNFKRIAATTPFSVKGVVEAGATLKAFGLDAEKTIKIVADLAAFMGRDIVDAASAVGRAFAGGIGAADILRETGIINRVLTKTGKSVKDFSGDLEGFRKALLNTLTDPTQGIVGVTDKISQTLEGRLSNMNDALEELGATLGNIFAPAVKESSKVLTLFLKDVTAFFGKLDELMPDDKQPKLTGPLAFEIEARELLKQQMLAQLEVTTALLQKQKEADEARKARIKLYGQINAAVAESNALLNQQVRPLLELITITTAVDQGISRISEVDIPEALRVPPEMISGWEVMRGVADDLTNTLSRSLVNALENGESAVQAMGAALKRMVIEFASELASKTIIWAFLNAVTGGGFGLLNPIGGFLFGPIGSGSLMQGAPAGGNIGQNSGSGGLFNITINTTDPVSFENYLRHQGGADAIRKTVGELL